MTVESPSQFARHQPSVCIAQSQSLLSFLVLGMSKDRWRERDTPYLVFMHYLFFCLDLIMNLRQSSKNAFCRTEPPRSELGSLYLIFIFVVSTITPVRRRVLYNKVARRAK